MSKPYPSEFRDDVVRVARNREPGVTIEQIARDFGVHPMTLQKWWRRMVPRSSWVEVTVVVSV
ncbi:transposase [Corynebacterium variabile]|uniref:transposase n=1 Tax=Corynebacterium variabile TaxID=1727 RepID=UPI003F984453